MEDLSLLGISEYSLGPFILNLQYCEDFSVMYMN